MINCAEKLVKRLPRFRQIDASRHQTDEDTKSQPPDNIRCDAEKLAAWRQGKQRAHNVADALYLKNWKALGRFQDKVRLKFGELSHLYSEGEGAGYKVLTDRETEALQAEMFIWDEIGLGGSLSSTLRALRTAIRLIDQASQAPSGHKEILIARGPDISEDTLKNNPPAVADPTSDKRGGGQTHQVSETREQRAGRRKDFVMPRLERFGWARSTLVTKSGLGKATVYEYLNGKRKWISRPNRKALADTLQVELTDLPE